MVAVLPPVPPVGTKMARLSDAPVVTPRTLSDKYEIIDHNGAVVLVQERLDLIPGTTVLQLAEKTYKPKLDHEIGAAGSTAFASALREDYNPDLIGELLVQKVLEMRTDAQFRAALRVSKTPVLGARYFVEPAGDLPLDIFLASFVDDNFMQWMPGQSWTELLIEALYMMDYGRYSFEKVFTQKQIVGPEGRPEKFWVWRKFSPRHPIEELEWIYDSKGGPKSLRVKADNATGYVEIPIEKMAVFIFDKEAGDFRGFSISRSAYKHWFYKENLYKIDAIQKERHGIGIPMIKLPPGFTETDKNIAAAIGESLRTNERAHVVLPPLWDLMFLKLEGQTVDALESARHHGNMLYQNVLAHFMVDVGNAEENRVNEATFVKGTRFIADIVVNVFNKYCIPQLLNFNWPIDKLVAAGELTGLPHMRVRRIGDTTDWRVLSFAMRNLAGMNALTPDDPMEEWLRDEMDLPRMDESTARVIEAPQAPVGGSNGPQAPTPGPPKQSRAGNQRIQPTQAQGNDKSGTSSS